METFKPNLENTASKSEKGQVPATQEEILFAQEWLSEHPIQVETKINPEQQIIEFENMIAGFEATYSLEELNAIVDLSTNQDRNHPLRDPAKESLKPIFAKLKALQNETTIDTEKYKELKSKWKILSNAVGMISNTGIVDHNR